MQSTGREDQQKQVCENTRQWMQWLTEILNNASYNASSNRQDWKYLQGKEAKKT